MHASLATYVDHVWSAFMMRQQQCIMQTICDIWTPGALQGVEQHGSGKYGIEVLA